MYSICITHFNILTPWFNVYVQRLPDYKVVESVCNLDCVKADKEAARLSKLYNAPIKYNQIGNASILPMD